jgi:3-oxoacyl-[acyl-carrier-protein] synthase II
MSNLFPLWMLKYLPNMPACHVGILHDARGPNNTLTLSEVSSLAAVAEAVEVLRRGQADAMIVGGTSSRINPNVLLRHSCQQISRRCDDPAAACRPFDADRDGIVYGEGAATIVLETREHVERRGAGSKVLARILGSASRYEPRPNGNPLQGQAIRAAIRGAMETAGVAPGAIGHVNANGLGTTGDDRLEAQAIRDTLGDVPVTALKGYTGNLVAATGLVEMVASILALQHGQVPAALNCQRLDPDCPIDVIRERPASGLAATALLLNHTPTGRAVATIVAAG